MSTVFNRTVEFGDAHKSDRVVVSFGGLGASMGFLLDGVQLQYAQAMQRIHNLTDNKTYFIAGTPEGQFSVTGVYGPSASTSVFLEQFHDVCSMKDNNLTMGYADGWCTGDNGSGVTSDLYTMSQCLITAVSGNLTSQQMMFTEKFDGIFCQLSKT